LKLPSYIRWIIAAAIVALAIWYVAQNRDSLKRLDRFDFIYLAPLLAVHLISLGLNGWMNRQLIAEFGLKLGFVQWYGLSAINALANYLPLPQAGAVVRGALLKRLHGLGYSRYTATVLYMYLASVVLMGLVGLGALARIARTGGEVSWILWAAYAALAAMAILLTPHAARLIPGKKLQQLAEGHRALGRWSVIGRLTFWKLITIAVNATGIWLAYRSLAHPEGWARSLVVALSAMVSNVVNVTPGNAGAAEAAAGVSARLIGADYLTAVNTFLIYRATAAIVIFITGPIALMLLSRQISAISSPSEPLADDVPPPSELIRGEVP
jgi:uncharacterized membrane protein YbhN (UPF0104 family)